MNEIEKAIRKCLNILKQNNKNNKIIFRIYKEHRTIKYHPPNLYETKKAGNAISTKKGYKISAKKKRKTISKNEKYMTYYCKKCNKKFTIRVNKHQYSGIIQCPLCSNEAHIIIV